MLVFWLSVVAGKVTFLITVETRDFTNVTFLLLFLRDIVGVNVGGRSLLFPLPSVFSFLILEPLFFIFSIVLLR